jgi:hypothetical protein
VTGPGTGRADIPPVTPGLIRSQRTRSFPYLQAERPWEGPEEVSHMSVPPELAAREGGGNPFVPWPRGRNARVDYVADVKGSEWSRLRRRVTETLVTTRMPHRGCQRAGASADVMRWITEATESARMLHGRCQRAEAGRGDAMGRRGNGSDSDALSQMSTDRKRASVRRWITGATGSTRMLHRRYQRAGRGPQ